MNSNFNIEQFLDLSNYATDERKARRKGGAKATQEFFTPYSIVKKMCDKIPDEDWQNPSKTFCEPCLWKWATNHIYHLESYSTWYRLANSFRNIIWS